MPYSREVFIGRLLRRAFEVLVLGFAFYGFASVPLGQRTALEHLLAILSTPEAEQAGREIGHASAQFVERIQREMERPVRPVRGQPQLPRFGALEPKLPAR